MPNQAALDTMARQVMQMHGDTIEDITYTHQESQSATPEVLTDLTVRLESFSRQEITADPLLLSDRRMRLPVYALTARASWKPSQFDTFERANGEDWRIMEIDGGPGTPFWLLRSRRVG